MKIIVENTNGIIDSAFFEIKDLSLNLFINTTDRWRKLDFVEFSDGQIKFCYFVDPESSDVEHDSVSLAAENDSEKSMLDRFYFLLPDREQLWVLMPDESVYT